jgi:hypothetical protein
MSKDMTKPNWARSVARLRRLAEILKANDFQVTEPPNFDKPPVERYAQGGPVTGVAVILGEHGPEILMDRDGSPISPRRSGDHGLS